MVLQYGNARNSIVTNIAFRLWHRIESSGEMEGIAYDPGMLGP